MTMDRLITAGVVVAVALVVWVVGRIVKKRLPERWGELVGQLVPVLVTAIVVVGALVVIDPEQADRLLESTISSVPRVLIAVIVFILARALGRIVGLFMETALRQVSAVIAGRARLLASSVITGIGLIIAMQQLGISTDIILVLVAAIAFGTALTVALGVGLGSVPVAKQVAAGRHVASRYALGDRVRIGDVEGVLADIGLVSSRLDLGEGRFMDIPNTEFVARDVGVG